MRSAIVTRPIDPAALVAEASAHEHGAVVLFVGTVRDVNDGRAVEGIEGASSRDAQKAKNLFALGVLSWLYDRPVDVTERWIRAKFKGPVGEANLAAFRAGWSFGETSELIDVQDARLAFDRASHDAAKLCERPLLIVIDVAARLADELIPRPGHPRAAWSACLAGHLHPQAVG